MYWPKPHVAVLCDIMRICMMLLCVLVFTSFLLQVIHRMGSQAPPRALVEGYLIEIAQTHHIDFTPDESALHEGSSLPPANEKPGGFFPYDGNGSGNSGPGYPDDPPPPFNGGSAGGSSGGGGGMPAPQRAMRGGAAPAPTHVQMPPAPSAGVPSVPSTGVPSVPYVPPPVVNQPPQPQPPPASAWMAPPPVCRFSIFTFCPVFIWPWAGCRLWKHWYCPAWTPNGEFSVIQVCCNTRVFWFFL